MSRFSKSMKSLPYTSRRRGSLSRKSKTVNGSWQTPVLAGAPVFYQSPNVYNPSGTWSRPGGTYDHGPLARVGTVPSEPRFVPREKATRPRRKGNRMRRATMVSNGRNQFVLAPSAIGSRSRNLAAQYRTIDDLGTIRIAKSEIVADIPGSVNFSTGTLPVNAGQTQTFPYLSSVATNFEYYQFERLTFEYRPRTSTTSTGAVAMSIDYDASDNPPVGKNQLLIQPNAIDTSPWVSANLICPDRDLRRRKTYLVRIGAAPVNTDIKFYDVGNLTVATYGQAGTAVVGELWVHYVCLLSEPQLNVGLQATSAVYSSDVDRNTQLAEAPSSNLNANYTTQVGSPYGITITFLTDYSGVISANLVGTVLGVPLLGGTATPGFGVFATNGTFVMATGYSTFSALAGQTLVLQSTNTTITSANFVISPINFPLVM